MDKTKTRVYGAFWPSRPLQRKCTQRCACVRQTVENQSRPRKVWGEWWVKWRKPDVEWGNVSSIPVGVSRRPINSRFQSPGLSFRMPADLWLTLNEMPGVTYCCWVIVDLHSWATERSWWAQFSLAYLPDQQQNWGHRVWHPTKSYIIQVSRVQLGPGDLKHDDVTLTKLRIAESVCRKQANSPFVHLYVGARLRIDVLLQFQTTLTTLEHSEIKIRPRWDTFHLLVRQSFPVLLNWWMRQYKGGRL